MSNKIIRYFFLSFIFITLVQVSAQVPSDQQKALNCTLESKTKLVNCDYRYDLGLDVKEISLKVGESLVQLDKKNISNYPVDGQSTAVLVLIDTSDPRRKDTVETKIPKLISTILDTQKPHQKIGIAGFDTEIHILAPISTDNRASKEALKDLKANGQATEFYKSILSGIDLLQKTEATRKGILLISDGKDEDKAYKREDVVKAANDSNITILGIGYSERPTDLPYLQNIEWLSKETHGQFINPTNQDFSSDFMSQPFGFLEKGGRISFDSSAFFGERAITLILGTKSSKKFELSTKFVFPEIRSDLEIFNDWAKKYWKELLVAVMLLIAAVGIGVNIIRKKNKQPETILEFAYLIELDSANTRHSISKSAVTIGRNPNNDIYLSNDSISSHHAEIHRKRGGEFYIVDLSSTNGVVVNDKKVDQTVLSDRDLVELGEVRMTFNIVL